ncbi:FAD binding domain-containing protein [Megalodesulfovibrio paquesii]
MTPDVRCPKTLAELWPLLDAGAVVLAGGTDLLARRNVPGPALLACVDRLEALRGVHEEDGLLRLGAGETHARLLRHPAVAGRLAVLARALAGLGSPLIRNMGTLGGNIATASPAGDTLPPLLVLDAELELCSRTGARRLPLAACMLGPGQTALVPGEIIAAVRVRIPAADELQHFEKVGRRKALAISVVSLAAGIRRDREGRVTHARLALGSVAPRAIRCPRAEALLVGHRLEREVLAAAGEMIRQEISPITDVRASAGYRRAVAGNLLLRLAT